MDSNLNIQDELGDILNSSNDNDKSLNGIEGELDEELKRMENELEDESVNVDNDNDISYINSKKQLNVNSKEEGTDVYKEIIEDKYHNIKKFKCVSVIKEEKELCLKIMNYKNKRKEDFNCWKIKKELLDNQETFMLNLIETEQLSLNDYKSMIKNTLEIEHKLLKEIVNDKSLSSIEIEETKLRITNRINLINKELSENVDENNENESETNQQQQQQQKEQQQQTIQSNNNNTKDNKENNTKENKESYNNNNINSTNDNINTSNDITPLPQLTIDDLKLIVDLETLFDEYKSAFIYFKSHNLPDLKCDANSKAKIIHKGITAIKTGQGKTFSLKDFPPRITPSYICGCSPQEKQSQFTKLLNLIASELRKCELSNTMNSEQLYPKLKKQINPKHQQSQNEYTKLKQLQSLITKAKDDEWTRCPEYDYVEYKEMIEKVNENVAENCVVIRLSNLTYEYENLFIEVSCNEFENVKKCRIDPVDDKNKTYNMDVVWFMSSREFKNLFRKKIEVKLYSSGYFFNSLRGEFQYKLHSLKSITSIRERIPIEIKNEMFYMNIQIDIRRSCVEPEMVERTYNKFAVTKVYPKFEFIIEDIFAK